MWVAAESLVWVTLAATVPGFAWLRDGESRLRPNVRFGAGLWGALAIALVLERPLSDILAIEYDRLSVVHLGIATALLSFWFAIWLRQAGWAVPVGFARGGTGERGLVGAGGGMLGIAALLTAFPGILEGPFAELDPRLDAAFFDRVAELAPLLPSGAETTGDYFFFIGSGLVVLPIMLGLA